MKKHVGRTGSPELTQRPSSRKVTQIGEEAKIEVPRTGRSRARGQSREGCPLASIVGSQGVKRLDCTTTGHEEERINKDIVWLKDL